MAVGPRYSPSSLRTYQKGLRKLLSFGAANRITNVNEIKPETLDSLRVWLFCSGLAGSTVNLVLRSVKLFLKWSHGKGLTLWDGASYSLPAATPKIPKAPAVAVMKRLLKLPDRRTNLGSRDLFVLELLYGLGLRRAELCSLNLESMDLEAETLRVTGKGGHERLLPLGPHLLILAQRYLWNTRPRLVDDPKEPALILNCRGQRLSENSLRRLVSNYGKKLGVKLSPHALRHACATHLTESGMKLTLVSQLLGHQSLDSTKRYAQVRSRGLERAFRRAEKTQPRKGTR